MCAFAALCALTWPDNVALSTFFVAYIIFEIPATMTCKVRPSRGVSLTAQVMGPGRFIPLITFLFGLISLLTAFVSSYGGLCAVRFFLGVRSDSIECG